jgi:hypothetical protein
MCGSSKEQKAAYAADTALSNTVMSDMNLNFKENAQILDSIKSAYEPILNAGIYQFGYSPEETTSLRTQASEGTTIGAQNAEIAAGARAATAGGGTTLLPSGAQEAINAGINESAAQENSREQLGITTSGYETGRQNFLNAEQVLSTAPGELQNPVTNTANAASNANKNTSDEANAITAANQAWMAPLAGVVGGVINANPKNIFG